MPWQGEESCSEIDPPQACDPLLAITFNSGTKSMKKIEIATLAMFVRNVNEEAS